MLGFRISVHYLSHPALHGSEVKEGEQAWLGSCCPGLCAPGAPALCWSLGLSVIG